MNKMIVRSVCFFLVWCGFSLSAELQSKIEIRSDAFFPSSHLFRKLYGNVGGNYQVEGTAKIKDCLDAWANFDCFWKHGKGNRSGKTHARISNVGLGVKLLCPVFECFDVYIGLGATLAKMTLKNESRCVKARKSKLVVGGVLKSGIYIFVSRQVFIDLFADYVYQPIHYEKHANIGGFKTGAGIGIRF